MKNFIGVKDAMINLVTENANFIRDQIENSKYFSEKEKKEKILDLRETVQKKLKALLLSKNKLELMEKGPYEYRR